MFRKIGIGVAAFGAVLFGAYFRSIHPWRMHWGASGDEVHRPLCGDELIVHPKLVAEPVFFVMERRCCWGSGSGPSRQEAGNASSPRAKKRT